MAMPVIIPAYKAGRYLEQTVQSVLAQTVSERQLVIVNDESADGTALVAQSDVNRRGLLPNGDWIMRPVAAADRFGPPKRTLPMGASPCFRCTGGDAPSPSGMPGRRG
jgi:glycosyltransferase involved in cell wall biosynthesis